MSDANYTPALQDYVAGLFAAADPGYGLALDRMAEAGLPAIAIGPDEGRFLAVMARAVGARTALEIGTLGGYSGLWIAGALPPDGRLLTIEADPRHAEVARGSFAACGLADRVDVVEGLALDVLPTLQPHAPFDLVFIDADKDAYASYLEWASRLARPGAVILAHNAYGHGEVVAEDGSARVRGLRGLNARVASDPSLTSAIVPLRDGMTVSIVGGTP